MEFVNMVAIATLAIAGIALLVVVGVALDQGWQHKRVNKLEKEVRSIKQMINHGKERKTSETEGPSTGGT